MTPPVIALVLLATLVVAVLGIVEYAKGAAQNRAVSVRTALDAVEARAARLDVRADIRLRRTRLGRYVERRLAASGVDMLTSTAVALYLGASALVSVAIHRSLSTSLAPLGFVAVAYVASMYLHRRQGQRRDRFLAQLPQLARALSNATSAGLAIGTAIALAADDLEAPAGEEMRRVADAMTFGKPLDDALRDLEERMPARELSVLVSTLVISTRAGGSLIEALRNIAATLEARKELRREVKTLLAQSVYTGYLVVGLGIAILVMLNSARPGLLDEMLSRPLGQIALAVATLLFATGLFLVNRVTRIEV